MASNPRRRPPRSRPAAAPQRTTSPEPAEPAGGDGAPADEPSEQHADGPTPLLGAKEPVDASPVTETPASAPSSEREHFTADVRAILQGKWEYQNLPRLLGERGWMWDLVQDRINSYPSPQGEMALVQFDLFVGRRHPLRTSLGSFSVCVPLTHDVSMRARLAAVETMIFLAFDVPPPRIIAEAQARIRAQQAAVEVARQPAQEVRMPDADIVINDTAAPVDIVKGLSPLGTPLLVDLYDVPQGLISSADLIQLALDTMIEAVNKAQTLQELVAIYELNAEATGDFFEDFATDADRAQLTSAMDTRHAILTAALRDAEQASAGGRRRRP